MRAISYVRHRFPPAIIQHAVWLSLRFHTQLCNVEDLLAERGLDVSCETVRRGERRMQWFTSAGSAQRFLSVHATVNNTFNIERNLLSRLTPKPFRAAALEDRRIATAASA